MMKFNNWIRFSIPTSVVIHCKVSMNSICFFKCYNTSSQALFRETVSSVSSLLKLFILTYESFSEFEVIFGKCICLQKHRCNGIEKDMYVS